MDVKFKYESKFTARIDRDIYTAVQNHLHHGQQTQLFRCLFLSLKRLIDANKFDEILDYLYKDTELTLPSVKD